ncbi:probable L-type lectin-domain containing receptor kinase S.5 [Zingiber officinale]|uniref:probable L-type lectin-domain containing receptor kinase S.5 n=1 Tax=Zingiber officinale TaxID=94328 RepID=UPI001C4CB551|nr:probable L-type lectin-domain containing receptor kinase S.5 [Zingiber officinale]
MIVSGVAAATLDYLHHNIVRWVVHRDIKTSNVMLDEEFSAWLGDFGLVQVVQCSSGKLHYSTEMGVADTKGYMAPKCYFTGHAVPKMDMYAFGEFAMEVACSRRSMSYVVDFEDDDNDISAGKIIVGEEMHSTWKRRIRKEMKSGATGNRPRPPVTNEDPNLGNTLELDCGGAEPTLRTGKHPRPRSVASDEDRRSSGIAGDEEELLTDLEFGTGTSASR